MIMNYFKRDLKGLYNDGFIPVKNKQIRFVFRYGDMLKGDLGNLDLSLRAYNSLRRAGISTIEGVAEKWDNLNRIKNIGEKIVKEVKSKYVEYYYGKLENEYERAQFWEDTINGTIEM